jgi:hypothetical protein
MKLILSQEMFQPGDDFHLYFYLHNPESENYDCTAYLLLGVYGYYWSWPSWKEITEELGSKPFEVPQTSSVLEEVLRFDWPDGVGSADGLQFIGAIFEPGGWTLIGDVQAITWGYAE